MSPQRRLKAFYLRRSLSSCIRSSSLSPCTESISRSESSFRPPHLHNRSTIRTIPTSTKIDISDITTRLQEVNDILEDDLLIPEQRGYHIWQIYQKERANLVADLALSSLTYPKSKLDEEFATNIGLNDKLKLYIKGSICKIALRSANVRALILDQILTNIFRKECFISCEFLVYVTEQLHLAISSSDQKQLETLYLFLLTRSELDDQKISQVQSLLCEFCIAVAIAFGRPMVAALLLTRCIDELVHINPQTVKKVLLSLSVYNPSLVNYHYYVLLKISLRADAVRFDPAFYLRLIANMCRDGNDPYFANILSLHALENCKILARDPTSDISSLKYLIQANLNFGNVQRAQKLWSLCYDHKPSFAEQSTALFRRLFLACRDSEKFELLNDYFPSDLLQDRNILDIVLAFYGKNRELGWQFNAIAKALVPPVSRIMLSSLLDSFLAQGKKNEVSLLTKAIFDTQGGFSSRDLDSLARHLLLKSEFSEAFRILYLNHTSTSKQGFVTFIECILSQSLMGKYPNLEFDNTMKQNMEDVVHDFYPEIEIEEAFGLPVSTSGKARPRLQSNVVLNFIAVQLLRVGNDSVLYDLTVVILNYLVLRDGGGVGRRFYMNRNRRNGMQGFAFDFVRFGLPKAFVNLMRINESNSVKCLEIILEQAKKEQDLASIEWCLTELRKSGLLVVDISQNYFSQVGKGKETY